MVLMLLPGCLFGIQGSGVEATEDRQVGAFTGVRDTTSVDVDLAVGVDLVEGEPSVSVTCDDNLLEHLLTEVRDGVLVVTTPPGTGIQPVARCFVEVNATGALRSIENTGSGQVLAEGAFPDLAEIRASGSGEIDVSGIDAGKLSASLSGSGRVRLEGGADRVDYDLSGSGALDAFDLVAVDADVRVSGSGSASLTATGDVVGHVSGSGNVVIEGDPDHVERHVTGSGDITVR
jgi:hypothetical protein